MSDREAIIDLIYRYCRAVDRMDAEAGKAIWHADGEADYGEAFVGRGHDFIDWVNRTHAPLLAHSHQVTNIILEVDSDRAASESYYTTALRLEREGRLHEIRVWGRYLDSWSKRDGRWGVDKRIALRDFDDIRPVAAISSDARSRRDRSDPSYAVLG